MVTAASLTQVVVIVDVGIVAVVVSMQVEGSSSSGGGHVVGTAEWDWWLCRRRQCGGRVHRRRWQDAGGADGCVINANQPLSFTKSRVVAASSTQGAGQLLLSK